MLKLTLKPGEYINIGEDVKVIFSGGSANNKRFLKKLNAKLRRLLSVRKQNYNFGNKAKLT